MCSIILDYRLLLSATNCQTGCSGRAIIQKKPATTLKRHCIIISSKTGKVKNKILVRASCCHQEFIFRSLRRSRILWTAGGGILCQRNIQNNISSTDNIITLIVITLIQAKPHHLMFQLFYGYRLPYTTTSIAFKAHAHGPPHT